MEKQDLRTVSDSIRDNIRVRVLVLLEQGFTQKEAAKIFGVNKNSITNWVKRYKANGKKGLVGSKRGVKSEDKKLLSTEQELSIQKMIIDKMPDQLKLSFSLWTRKAVKELVEREFGVVLAINTMGDYLRSWGYSPQKPKKKAYEQNPKAVQKWIEEEYPAIKNRAKEEGAEIQWGDETGVRNSNQHGRSYAPKGKIPIKKSMAKRFSVNMISTITNKGKVEFMIYIGSMNADRLYPFGKLHLQDSGQEFVETVGRVIGN
jgi:transposase